MFWWKAFQFLENVMIYLYPVYSARFNLLRSVLLRMCWSFQVNFLSSQSPRTSLGRILLLILRLLVGFLIGWAGGKCIFAGRLYFCVNVCKDISDDDNNANARSPCGWQWSRLGWPSLVHGCVQVSYISSFARQILGIEQFPVNQSNDTIG